MSTLAVVRDCYVSELCLCAQVPVINVRGVQLAALLMHGIEHVLFVNDVVGSPLPLNLFCPWLFFNGKLFQYKLLKSTTTAASLRQLCDDSVRTDIDVFVLSSVQLVSDSFYALLTYICNSPPSSI